MELKGSKTEQNLLAAFAGESQARNKPIPETKTEPPFLENGSVIL